MPRHILHPLPRAFAGSRDTGSKRQNPFYDDDVWSRMDRVQVLGDHSQGHRGCVNALSWADDGSSLLSGSDDRRQFTVLPTDAFSLMAQEFDAENGIFRLCIWQPDPSASSSTSPHPMKLMESIQTGHQANIFSAKYLPNTSSSTIVSCAGDRDVRVLDVERLVREVGGTGWNELNGVSGPGVTVLKCHRDRAKRIATENSPSLFLTVSEDGTVRQHDLRRPHRCRSECPEPLFHAPRGIDLYSLSVSTVTPHIFAVAGRTDCAFICDRRMPERQTPSWGSHTKASGQVHCVRRLGLPEHEWDAVEKLEGNRFMRNERHITCVKLSPDKADEAICAFAKHSTALFSIYDSPASNSMRSTSPKSPVSYPKPKLSEYSPNDFLLSPPESKSPSKALPDLHNMPEPLSPTEGNRSIETSHTGSSESGVPGIKRRISELSVKEVTDKPVFRQRTLEIGTESERLRQMDGEKEVRPEREIAMNGIANASADTNGMNDSAEAGPSRFRVGGDQKRKTIVMDGQNREEVTADEAFIGPQQPIDDDDDMRELATEDGSTPTGRVSNTTRDAAGPSGAGHLSQRRPPSRPPEIDMFGDLQSFLDDHAIFEDEDDFLDLDGIGDEDDDDDDDDEDEMDEDDFGDILDSDEDEEGEESYIHDPRSDQTVYGSVEVVHPRRYFKGARNAETVKDCNFLGSRSDKVASGSDDGNFFVWDKDTGRLEGIWKGDGSVVNVMEQHPNLPIVAVSGIDSTVKLFGPLSKRPVPSFSRMSQADQIIKDNIDRPSAPSASMFGRTNLLQLLATRGYTIRAGSGDDDGEEGDDRAIIQQCATQ